MDQCVRSAAELFLERAAEMGDVGEAEAEAERRVGHLADAAFREGFVVRPALLPEPADRCCSFDREQAMQRAGARGALTRSFRWSCPHRRGSRAHSASPDRAARRTRRRRPARLQSRPRAWSREYRAPRRSRDWRLPPPRRHRNRRSDVRTPVSAPSCDRPSIRWAVRRCDAPANARPSAAAG